MAFGHQCPSAHIGVGAKFAKIQMQIQTDVLEQLSTQHEWQHMHVMSNQVKFNACIVLLQTCLCGSSHVCFPIMVAKNQKSPKNLDIKGVGIFVQNFY